MLVRRIRWLFLLVALLTSGAIFSVDVVLAGEPFVAIPPYNPALGNSTVFVDLAGKVRNFDFGGRAPFVNPATSVSDLATINVWDAVNNRATVLTSNQIASSGVPGRVFKTGGYTAIGYVHGDGIVEGKLRTQLNSYPIPARRRYIWELTVRFGGASLFSTWVPSARGVAPATIWQLKSEGLPPALVMAFDTDPADPEKLALSFDSRLDPARSATNLGNFGGLEPLKDINVTIDVFLDERSIAQGGKGYLRVSVNGALVVDRWGPVLQAAATFPYHWSLGMYLFSNTAPLPFDRFGFWKNARLITFE